MGFGPTDNDPCLYVGYLDDKRVPIYLGLYVDDFVYFSTDKSIEHKFEAALANELDVDFMGTVEWFLGIQFTWRRFDDGNISVHLNQ